jgi:membrane protein required for beta-lactamase induction
MTKGLMTLPVGKYWKMSGAWEKNQKRLPDVASVTRRRYGGHLLAIVISHVSYCRFYHAVTCPVHTVSGA